jgi:uroporphyrin-III C-methyltransferase/precorrin-2 dehydrogenase/sirohydrochlorin ferrochelatase
LIGEPQNVRPGSHPPLFPTFLKLAGRPVLIVGGGTVAAAKLAALRDAGARVTVVAPQISAPLRQPGVVLHERGFEPADLEGVWFVVAAAIPEVNRRVVAAADGRRLFVNAVDDPAVATAYAGGIVRRGEVTVAVSTGGEAPALAGLLREGLEALLPDDLPRWAEAARTARDAWRAAGVPIDQRRPLLLAALNRLYEERAR